MKIYDTIIIGSGYFSAGFALKRGNCIICEKSELCDTHFYAPFRSFKYVPYSPVTEYGAKLTEIFEGMELFSDGMQNLSNFECAFCSFLENNPVDILLKCTVVSTEKQNDGTFVTTVHTNSGLEYIYSRNVLDTTSFKSSAECYFTVLFMTPSIENEINLLSDAFPSSYYEAAFYKNRYALHIPVYEKTDINVFKLNILDKWQKSGTKAKILYFPPTFGYQPIPFSEFKSDNSYENPVAALDAGVLAAERGMI